MKRVGYWRSDREPNLPLASHFIDSSWNEMERLMVMEYLKSGKVESSYFGFSFCRICEKDNGCVDLTDGEWIWPEGLYHYVAHHNLKPDQEFIDHIWDKRLTEVDLMDCGCRMGKK